MSEIVQNRPGIQQNPKLKTPLLIVIGILLAVFAYGAVVTLVVGHDTWGTTNEFPWGILISGYEFFAVGCTGIYLISTLGHRDWVLKLVFGNTKFTKTKEFEEEMRIKPIVLAISFMMTAFIILALELKYPLNLAIYSVLSPNFKSPFIWMGYLYGIFLVFLLLEVVFHMKHKETAMKIASFLAITAGLIATSNVGAVFGTMPGRAFWTAPYLQILFIFTALLTGTAALMVLYYFTSKQSREEIVPYLSKLLVLFIIVVGILTAWNIVSGIIGQYPERYEATMYLLTGDLSLSFWLFEVGLGLLIPLAIVLLVKTPRMLMVAAVMVLIGMMFARYNLVTVGQIVLLQPDSSAPIYLLSYTPTIVELSMVVGGVGVLLTLYFTITKLVAKLYGKNDKVDKTQKVS